MASVTRSTRRAEGLHHHHPHRGPLSRPAPGAAAAAAGLYHHDGRQKRGLEAADREIEAFKSKKTRIAVEIIAKASPTDGVRARPPPIPRQLPVPATNRPPPPLPQPQQATRPQDQQPAAEADPNLTKHQAKVINGIKHELDRLQPQPADTREQGRKLRSQEATRFKSELSAYFPDYDEVIGNDPKEQRACHNRPDPLLLQRPPD